VATTRDRILTATNELFRRHGFNGTSIKQITLAARVPMGSLYHFFPEGKDQVAREAIEASGPAYEQLFEIIADEAADVSAAVTNFFEGAAEVLEATDFVDICPIGTVAREVASTNDALRVATATVFASWIAAVAARLEAAGVPDPEANGLATTVVASLEGGFMLARAARNTAPLLATGTAIRLLVDTALALCARSTVDNIPG
jgi:AcrR family transcriptional regulator